MQYNHSARPTADTRFQFLPAQVVEIDGGIIIVRGCTEVKILGEGALEALQQVMSVTQTPSTLDEIVAPVAEPNRDAIRQLAEKLIERRILVDADGPMPDPVNGESSLDVFYWHFGLTNGEAVSRLTGKRFAILGLNAISKQMAETLRQSGIDGLTVVDFVELRNQRLFGHDQEPDLSSWPGECSTPVSYRTWLAANGPAELDCLIVTTDFGATSMLQQWNRTCMNIGVPMLPVMLRNMVGYVGPLVIPGETACYDCLQARENSHIDDFETVRKTGALAPQLQAVSGYFPSMGSILGDFAAMELVKFYTNAIPTRVAGSLIEVNLLAPALQSRRVLRVPRCATCAPTLTQPAHSLERADFIPGPQFVEGEKEPTTKPMSPAEKFGVAKSPYEVA